MPSASLVALVCAATVGCAPSGHPIVTEVFYDAVGDDTGLEFVELWNRDSVAASLQGARLEAGDGAGPGRWTPRWTGPAGATIAPGARFVIGGARVVPVPDAVVELSLQNGPDAVRMVWPDGATEVVGYGVLADSEYFCGRPAVDAAAGQSLARIPDGADLGANDLDFRAATPSPGHANLPQRHVEWIPASLSLTPEQPDAGAPARLMGRARNAGALPIAAGALAARALERDAAGIEVERGRIVWASDVAPGDTLALAIDAAAGTAGVATWTAVLALAGDEQPERAVDSLRVRTGAGPLALTEVQYHPAHEEGEWIEARNASGGPLDVHGWTLTDRSGTRGVADASAPCPPDSLLLLAQDPTRLAARYPGLDTARVVRVHPWPALNNSDGKDGIADGVTLRDADGLPSDAMSYSAAGVADGVPLERDPDGRWRASLDPNGSPLAPEAEPTPIRGRFALARARLPSGTANVHVAWSLPWAARVRVDAYELDGGWAGELLDDSDAPARGERDLAVAGLSPGLHVLVLHAVDHAGHGAVDASQLLRTGTPPR